MSCCCRGVGSGMASIWGNNDLSIRSQEPIGTAASLCCTKQMSGSGWGRLYPLP